MKNKNDATVGFSGDDTEPYEGRTAGAQGALDVMVTVADGEEEIDWEFLSAGV